MAISFSCPSCEHGVKVKDELAGRKVKCPQCGEGMLVPNGEEPRRKAAAAVAVSGAQAGRSGGDVPDLDERPRKKKKKKKSNTGLWIGLGIGGLVLLLLVLLVVLNLPRRQSEPGDQVAKQKPPDKQQPVQQPPAPPPQPHPEQRVAGIANRGQDTEIMNDFRQIGLFYQQSLLTNPRGPKSSKTFADEIRRDSPRIAQALDNQLYFLLPGVRRGANAIVAYDVPGNTANNHIVLMGDGSVQTMPAQELQQYLQQQGNR
jgi:hypothetical protein